MMPFYAISLRRHCRRHCRHFRRLLMMRVDMARCLL